MLNKDFYITYGKLLYALAKSDGYIQVSVHWQKKDINKKIINLTGETRLAF